MEVGLQILLFKLLLSSNDYFIRKSFSSIIIYNLRAYGFVCRLIDWISVFLIDRKQRVVISEISSSWCDVDSGLPQWSVLGPLLFIFYINDLPNNLTHKFKLYAEDGKQTIELGTDQDDNDLQSDMNEIVKWC